VSLGTQALVDVLVSHAASSGRFDRVNAHEPKNVPGSGLTAALWAQELRPIPASGLDTTSVLFVVQVRIYQSMLSEPQDAIDPAVFDAADDLMSRYTGDFTLGGLVRSLDLLGSYGTPLSGQAGYVETDRILNRCFTLTVPLIVNDVWSQVA
jgi:hypothetical protein